MLINSNLTDVDWICYLITQRHVLPQRVANRNEVGLIKFTANCSIPSDLTDILKIPFDLDARVDVDAMTDIVVLIVVVDVSNNSLSFEFHLIVLQLDSNMLEVIRAARVLRVSIRRYSPRSRVSVHTGQAGQEATKE